MEIIDYPIDIDKLSEFWMALHTKAKRARERGKGFERDAK